MPPHRRSPELGLSHIVALAASAFLAGLAAGAEPPARYTETITTKRGTKFSYEMVLIPGGKFTMGSPANEPDRKPHEGPQHEVELKPFYLCTTEATLEQYNAFYLETHQKVRGLDPGRGDPLKEAEDALAPPPVDAITGPTPLTHVDITSGWGAGKQPVKMVTWFNAQVYCKWLWQKTGRKHRLPTEAEWEYACRAGTISRYFFGDDPGTLDDYAWFEDNSSGDFNEPMTHEVAQKKPNAWGLYDMLGNVSEWVLDFYSPATYAENAKAKPCPNPRGPAKGKYHVARGGFFDSPPADLRCAARAFEEDWWDDLDPNEPKSRWFLPKRNFIGFRVAREIEEK